MAGIDLKESESVLLYFGDYNGFKFNIFILIYLYISYLFIEKDTHHGQMRTLQDQWKDTTPQSTLGDTKRRRTPPGYSTKISPIMRRSPR